MYVCVFVCLLVCLYACLLVCLYVYLYMYIYVYAYAFVYTYRHRCNRQIDTWMHVCGISEFQTFDFMPIIVASFNLCISNRIGNGNVMPRTMSILISFIRISSMSKVYRVCHDSVRLWWYMVFSACLLWVIKVLCVDCVGECTKKGEEYHYMSNPAFPERPAPDTCDSCDTKIATRASSPGGLQACVQCNRWLCVNCRLRQEIGHCIECPVLHASRGGLLPSTLKCPEQCLSEQHVEALTKRADELSAQVGRGRQSKGVYAESAVLGPGHLSRGLHVATLASQGTEDTPAARKCADLDVISLSSGSDSFYTDEMGSDYSSYSFWRSCRLVSEQSTAVT